MSEMAAAKTSQNCDNLVDPKSILDENDKGAAAIGKIDDKGESFRINLNGGISSTNSGGQSSIKSANDDNNPGNAENDTRLWVGNLDSRLRE